MQLIKIYLTENGYIGFNINMYSRIFRNFRQILCLVFFIYA